MSDDEDRRAEARELAAEDRIGRINRRRHDAACSGEPGDPPAYICEGCGFEECACVAVFIGYQEDGDGGYFPLFNIPSSGGGMTTVSEKRVVEEGVTLPDFPTFEEWIKKHRDGVEAIAPGRFMEA